MEFTVVEIILSPNTSSFVWIDSKRCLHYLPCELAEIARKDDGLLMGYIRQQKLVYKDFSILILVMLFSCFFYSAVYALTGEVHQDILSIMGLYFVMNGAEKFYSNSTFSLINPWHGLEVLVLEELGVQILDDD